MTDGSKHRPNITAGVDTGDKHSYLCLLDTASGEVMEEGRLRATPEAFRRRFSSEQPMRIAIEAGTHSPWVSRLLEECGHEVLPCELGTPSSGGAETATKIAAPLARKDGSHNSPSHRRAGSPRVRMEA